MNIESVLIYVFSTSSLGLIGWIIKQVSANSKAIATIMNYLNQKDGANLTAPSVTPLSDQTKTELKKVLGL